MPPLTRLGKRKLALSSPGDVSIIHREPRDRISQLPDDLIHHILSSLDVFDALDAAFLSKRWADVCSRLTSIDIHIPQICAQRHLSMSEENLDRFVNFITWVLSSRSAVNVTTLRIVWCCPFVDYQLSPDLVFHWMLAAATRNVQEFILFCQPSDIFRLPSSFISCQSLQILQLDLYGQTLQLPSDPGLTRLKTLRLTQILLTDEDSTRTFFSGCRFLNKLVLSIDGFENMKVLDISSSSIEYLFFVNAYSVGCVGRMSSNDSIDLKISCPRLIVFKYEGPVAQNFIFEDMSSLETMHMNPCPSSDSIATSVYGFLKTAHKIVDLKLGMNLIFDLKRMGDKFRCDLCSFHRLKALHMWISITDVYLGFLSLLLEHCDNLEALTLYCEGEH